MIYRIPIPYVQLSITIWMINTSFSFFRFILHSKKTAFVVEHDFIMATYLADRVVVYDGRPSVHAMANT
jgi:translation initiation factor RLI1